MKNKRIPSSYSTGKLLLYDGELRSGRPERIRHLVTMREWSALKKDVSDALAPAVRFKRLITTLIFIFFAIPVVSFVCLLFLIHSEVIVLDEAGETEAAFKLLLEVVAAGSISLTILILFLASFIRRVCIESYMDVSLAKVVYAFECNAGDKGISIDIIMSPNCRWCVRRTVLAWCDVDYILLISADNQKKDPSAELDYHRL